MKSEQRFAIELQAEDGRRISGVLLAYGVVAVLPWGEEKFEPHAFDVYSADVSLTIQHDRSRPVARTGAGLTLRNSSKALSMEAEILRTREGDAALVNIKGGERGDTGEKWLQAMLVPALKHSEPVRYLIGRRY